jgi:hypothetical protein
MKRARNPIELPEQTIKNIYANLGLCHVCALSLSYCTCGNPESEAGKAIIGGDVTVYFYTERGKHVGTIGIEGKDYFDKHIFADINERYEAVNYCRKFCKKHYKTFNVETFVM